MLAQSVLRSGLLKDPLKSSFMSFHKLKKKRPAIERLNTHIDTDPPGADFLAYGRLISSHVGAQHLSARARMSISN